LLQNFFGNLRAGHKLESREYFSSQAQYVDACGRRWSGEQNFHEKMDELFAPFAARGARYVLEETTEPRLGVCIASLLWEDVPLVEKTFKGLCRMVVMLSQREDGDADWFIDSVQVTPVTRA
jgi:hypothetical protein